MNIPNDRLMEYIKAGIIKESDLTPAMREQHDKLVKMLRESTKL